MGALLWLLFSVRGRDQKESQRRGDERSKYKRRTDLVLRRKGRERERERERERTGQMSGEERNEGS